MILAFDIGNTNVVFCVMKDGEVIHQFRFETDPRKTTDEYAISILYLVEHHNIDLKNIKAAMVSSVVPQLTFLFTRLIEKYLELTLYVVDTRSDHGLNILLDNPDELGSDRLMSALASYTRYKRNCITVDFGTATTLEVVTAQGDFMGGVIFPGIKLAAQALRSGTAKLPEVDLARPEMVVGRNTVKSIQSGLFYGYVELVDGLIDRIKKEEFTDSSDLFLLSTGGMGRGLSEASRHKIQYEPNLIPYGLYIMYERMHCKIPPKIGI